MCTTIVIILIIFIILYSVIKRVLIENFELHSNKTQQSSGASPVYNHDTGNHGIKIKIPKIHLPKIHLPKIPHFPNLTPTKSDIPGPNPEPIPEPDKPDKKPKCIDNDNLDYYKMCKKCDITVNNNIDKYVLKNSIKPCNKINMSKYILKKDIKPCKVINKESKCPKCKKCPHCPTCPKCPSCPKPIKCKQIFDFEIKEHPDFNKYQLKSEYSNNQSYSNNLTGLSNNLGKTNYSYKKNNLLDNTKKEQKKNCDIVYDSFKDIKGKLKPFNSCPHSCSSEFPYAKIN